MIFNSLEFLVFLPIVFTLYWILNKGKLIYQNLLIVVASYIFYGWWNEKFLLLIFFSSVVDYFISKGLKKEENQRKRLMLLIISLCTNIGVLLSFKYFDFFIDSFSRAFSFFGYKVPIERLGLVIPVGISFYTFQTLSYSIDVYRRKIPPTDNIIEFLAFVSFFPQLVAGPIERASNLLPQFSERRGFDYEKGKEGLQLMLWGFFKKIVIADNCAMIVQNVYNSHSDYNGATLAVAAFCFSFQIYCDFSGYSDIAIGTAKLFNFDLKKNFNFPYFSRDISEFWRRWHISLSTWFRDYLYIPLGGSKGNKLNQIRNVFIIFLISGMWHGPQLNYIVWGGINAVLFLPLMLFGVNRKNTSEISTKWHFPQGMEIVKIIFTFFIVTLVWVFFSVNSVSTAIKIISKIISPSLFETPTIFPVRLLVIIALFFAFEWMRQNKSNVLAFNSRTLNWLTPYLILILIFFFGNFTEEIEFIYFQF